MAVSLEIVASVESLFARETLQLQAFARGSEGGLVAGERRLWLSDDPTVATVTERGLVSGLRPGPVLIRAVSGNLSDSLSLLVLPERAVVTVAIDLRSQRIIQGATTEAPRVVPMSATGDWLPNRTVTWSSSDSAVATVDASGYVVAATEGAAVLTASVEGVEATAVVIVESRSRFEGDCVFCPVYGATPGAPVWDDQRQGVLPDPGDLRDQIVIDETFSVPPGQEVAWDDLIVWIRPRARADLAILGTLTIRNSLLLWDQTEHQQAGLDVGGSGTLHIANSFAFSTNEFWVNWDYQDGATVYLNHFQGQPWTVLRGSADYTAVNGSTVKLTLLELSGARVQINDAHHVWMEIFPAPGQYDLTLPQKGGWRDWSLPSLWPGTTVTASDSYLYERDVSLGPGVHVTVSNTPDGFGLGWSVHKSTAGMVTCELRDLGDPDRDDGVLHANTTWSLPCIDSSLTVRNSLLQRAWPVTFGNVRLTLIDSNLVDPRNFGGPATLEIYGSTIDHVAAYQAGLVYLEDTRIRYDVQSVGDGAIIYGYDVTGRDRGDFGVFEDDGGRYVELDEPGSPWE